ncbi:hypothetical protein FQN54_004492 [Arachnomyces sp. PD_36]|nr:hypothetical protein FQN54_004492 [Arachnomyces sp. PD_36]
MASNKCQEHLSSQEGDLDDGPGTVKRAKHDETTDPSTSSVTDNQGLDEIPSTDPKVPVRIEGRDREDDRGDKPPQCPEPDANQPQPSSPGSHERRLGSQFWEAEYWKLKEIHDRHRDETRKEVALLKKERAFDEIEIDDYRWIKFHARKQEYARDCGYVMMYSDMEWGYGALSREIRNICWDIARNDDDLPATLARASDDPEYYPIAGECAQPWIEQILGGNYRKDEGVPLSFWVVERLVTRYVLLCTFEPMLVGLDKEVESLLLRVRASMESRMVPLMAHKWMGETLRSYTLLPKYDQDRSDYLRGHTRYLQKFGEHFFPVPESIRHTGRGDWMIRSREKILEKIVEPAAELATQMSFSYDKFEVDWGYCERTTEIFHKDLENHEVWESNGSKLAYRHFPGFEAEEKIGDVILFVKPPITRILTTGIRGIYGVPIVVVKPVSGYVWNPSRREP